MRHTEFWDLLDRVFPGGRGQALASDLVLPELGSVTAEEALKNGSVPQEVWHAIRINMDLPEAFDYAHRVEPQDFPAFQRRYLNN